MPRISRFYGIGIAMHYQDRAPPHFHAKYGELEATIEIGTLSYLEGKLPRRVYGLVLEWAAQHRAAFLENWDQARLGLPLADIDPLD